MKTLYLSDMDGTLLDSKARLTDKTADILNHLTDKGMMFTVATARTYASVVPMMKNVNLRYPFVLMNGVCIFDPTELKSIRYNCIDSAAGKNILGVFEKNNKYPLMYFEEEGFITVEYKKLTTKSQEEYVNLGNKMYKKGFRKVDDFDFADKNLVYIVTLDKGAEIEKIYNEVSKRDDVTVAFYPDNYCDEYFLEIFNNKTSKASAALEVKKMLGVDKIVAFGDNLNDLPLFEVADESYAVSNACDELKAAATGIIGDNDSDAVADFLLERYNNGLI